MPRIITTAQEVRYLVALAMTGNATLAALHAGVSRSWAYKKLEADPGFAALREEAQAVAKANLPVRVNRDRPGGWTEEKEARFIAAQAAVRDVRVAAAHVGHSAGSAYYRRRVHPDFAAAWAEAERDPHAFDEHAWIPGALSFFEGEPAGDGEVRMTRLADMLRLMRRSLRRNPPGQAAADAAMRAATDARLMRKLALLAQAARGPSTGSG